ncbi:MAG TPA: hypothetical protein VM840_12355, partial [Actinomycetota bacterium]|nr:hypothetical protein [Actinomycetota bacterium]
CCACSQTQKDIPTAPAAPMAAVVSAGADPVQEVVAESPVPTPQPTPEPPTVFLAAAAPVRSSHVPLPAIALALLAFAAALALRDSYEPLRMGPAQALADRTVSALLDRD